MNYSKIKKNDIANGVGIRISLFVSGCKFHCRECFNPETWDYSFGETYTTQTESDILDFVKKEYVAGLSILGGDPMWQDDEGIDELISLAEKVKSTGKTVWMWSGFKFDDILSNGTDHQKKLLKSADIFVDGRFEIEKKDLNLQWRGSSNQRVIDVRKSLDSEEVVLWENN